MEDIKVIFQKILKEHVASIVQKNQEMFYKHEQSIQALKSGNNDKFQKLEYEINLMKQELLVIQTAKPSWAIETDVKSVDLEDRYRRNNLRFEGTKKH